MAVSINIDKSVFWKLGINFGSVAEKLTEQIMDWSAQDYIQTNDDELKLFLQDNGDLLQGDHLFNKEELNDMTRLLKNINIISKNMNHDNEQIVLDNNKITKNNITEII